MTTKGSRMAFSLVSPRGETIYNAIFVIGQHNIHKLEHNKWYTDDELVNIVNGSIFFIRDSSQATEKNIKKWRFVIE